MYLSVGVDVLVSVTLDFHTHRALKTVYRDYHGILFGFDTKALDLTSHVKRLVALPMNAPLSRYEWSSVLPF